ncbi:carbohydrate ABC transporter permease [Pelagibacterium montanilacus]|uniref:carbohydrate ABC transporter permease n=1 Tax=Pelagibacterium montanilacus TaxID=2185280 RepID=UPI0013DF0D61|nr:sugar ABC transporter permease [Pelagibacterium montanilacus]
MYPALFTLALSFAEFNMVRLSIERFVGFGNFSSLLANPQFVATAVRTIYFGLLVAFATATLGFLIALLLNEPFRGRGLVRVFVVLPWAVPPVVAGVLWGQMFHADVGFINAILYRLGLIDSYRIWLGDATTALHVIALAEIWKAIPFMVLFFLAGLQSLPGQVFEAAEVDGANVFQRFRYILMPLMVPVAIPLMLIQFVWAMKAFDTIFVLTRGGPGGGTTTLNYFVYQEAFQSFNLGRASASAYVLLLITLVVVIVMLAIRRLVSRHWEGAS